MKKVYLYERFSKAVKRINKLLKEENGETNIIAIILIILVVIILAAIFKEQLISIVNSLFEQIRDSLGV